MSDRDTRSTAIGEDEIETVAGLVEGRDATELPAGATVGRYVVIGRLGSGAMGDVFAAYDPELDRKVAIKLLRTAASGGRAREAARTRLMREAQALARLDHPNVVGVHDVGTYGDEVFIAMEFVRGETLRRFVAREKPDWRTVVDLFVQAGRGLAAAHAAGLVHRDFKPTNVMVDERAPGANTPRVRVMDFGLARNAGLVSAEMRRGSLHDAAMGASSSVLSIDVTRLGEGVGTPAYMAPEQRDAGSADPRADQFSFCVALYEALYGQRPFSGATLAELGIAIARGEVRPPPARARVPTRLFRILLRGLSTRPDDRFPDMNALLAALGRSPERRRRRLALGVVGVAAIAAAFGIRHAAHERAVAACEADSEALRTAWSDEVRTEVASAMASTNQPFARTVAQTVDRRLAELADEWAVAASAVCRHTRVDEDWPVERTAVAEQCLGEQRRRAEAFIARLRTADDRVVLGAVSSVYDLARPTLCADPAELRHRTDLSRVGGDDEAIADDLARLDAIASEGALEERRLELDAIVERAHAIESDLLRARALFARGRALQEAGVAATAEADLEQAYYAATRIGYDELAIDAAIALAQFVGVTLNRFDDGQRWARQADAQLTRAGIEGDMRQARLAAALSGIASAEGDNATAVSEAERALAAFRAQLGDDHPLVAAAENDLGFALFEQGRFDQAFASLDRVLEIRRRAFGDEHPIVSRSYNDLGVAHLERGDLDLAQANLERAVAIREHALGPDSLRLAASLSNLALVYSKRAEPERALALMERVRDIRVAQLGENHPDIAHALASISGSQFDLGRLDDAKRSLDQALAIQYEALGRDHPDTAHVLNLLGQLATLRGRPLEAIEPLERAIAVQTAARVGAVQVAETRFALAMARQALGETQAAERLLDAALAELAAAGPSQAKRQAEMKATFAKRGKGKPAK